LNRPNRDKNKMKTLNPES